MAIKDPGKIQVREGYEVWCRAERSGYWHRVGPLHGSKEAARKALREAKGESNYTEELKWRVYFTRTIFDRKEVKE